MVRIRLAPVIKDWFRRKAPNENSAAAPAWSVVEIIAGVTLAGDAIAALRLDALDGAAMPPLRLETWTATACVDDRRGLVKKCVNARQAAAFWVDDSVDTSTPST